MTNKENRTQYGGDLSFITSFGGWARTMCITEAKPLIGQVIDLTYSDRVGHETTQTVEVFDVNFVPLYGPCLITDAGDFQLDQIRGHVLTEDEWAKAA